jgi:hypothetical protein
MYSDVFSAHADDQTYCKLYKQHDISQLAHYVDPVLNTTVKILQVTSKII